jgi:hypothetical protein
MTSSINHKTANMVKKQPNQTASLIAINNDAINYLKMGELDESYSLLSEAVATLQRMSLEEQPTKCMPFRPNFQWTDLTDSNADYVFTSSNQSVLPFLFQRFLIVDMPRQREIRANNLCPFGLCLILDYNLALVAHLLGIQKEEYGKSYLHQAMVLYGAVSAHIQSRRCCADYVVLLMGIWNNQGCIYMEWGMEEQASSCLDLLRRLLMSTKASSKKFPGWVFFDLNLVILDQHRSVAAAA